MRVFSITPVTKGKFLNLYLFGLDDGRTYEVCSRKNPPNADDCDAVDIIAFNEDRSEVCIVMEYRPPVDRYICAFPAGLREADEEILETARRELWEECGLSIIDQLQTLEPSYQSPGMTDENVATVICSATGDLTNKYNTSDEHIHPMWFTKEMARKYLESGQPISARCQIFLAMWSGYIS